MEEKDIHMSGRWKALAKRPMLLDFVLALVLSAAVLKAALSKDTHQPTGWDVLIALTAFVAVLTRRRHPFMALTVATVSTTGAVVQQVNNPGLIVALGVITYTIAAHSGRRMGWTCALCASATVYLTVVVLNHQMWWRGEVLGIFAWVFLAAAVGDATRSHRAYIAEVEERARRAEQTREEEARRRVTEERLRIARELHDVVAHHIAVINVQAGAATHVLEKQPDQVAPVLAHIREASDNVLKEIQSVVGVLRSPEEPDSTEPAPGLGRLPDLLAGLESAGFRVDCRQDGESRELPALVDLAAYRIVQEALTNAHKHGDGGAGLRIGYADGGVVIEVVNGLRAGTVHPGSGYGLVGMRERAASAGGTVSAGVTPDLVFRVYAVLPVEAPAPAVAAEEPQAESTAPAPVPVKECGPFVRGRVSQA
jgi:signal transduction histidine kinase